MTRLFYSDPLEAAYMIKHFRMRIVVKENSESGIALSVGENMAQDAEWRNVCVMETGETKYYIHPDSLGLLEPIPGDVVRVTGRDGRNPQEPIAHLYVGKIQHDSIGVVMYPEDICVVERAGRPFFWPKSA